MLNFDPNQVEEYFAQNAVFKVELAIVELKFNVKALFNAHFHFNWFVLIRLSANVSDEELLLLSNAVVVSIDHNIDIVAQSYHNAVVAFKLFLYTIKLEVILYIICKSTLRF